MTVLVETAHAGGFLVSEAPRHLSREAVTIAAGADLTAGTILGRVLATSTTIAFAGVGNGTLTMDPTTPLLAGAQEGAYRVLCIEPASNLGQFEVFDPQGRLLGGYTVGAAAFASQVMFTIADGSTDFVAGAMFIIYVKAGTVSAVTGTGTGTLTLYQTMEGAVPGIHTLTCTATALNGGTFALTGPGGVSLGNATVGTRFNDAGLDFLIADGATDFAQGDQFTITVTRGRIKAWDPANSDGSGQHAYGILWDDARAATADCKAVAIARLAEVNEAEIVYPAGQLEAARLALRRIGIIPR